MMAPLLKQLATALGQYAAFHANRAVRGASSPAGQGTAPRFAPRGTFEWQSLDHADSKVYGGGPSAAVLDLLDAPPTFVLDVGCSNGDFSAHVRSRFPHSKIWGIEPGKDAARIAATRIDRVLNKKFEDINWAKEGVAPGTIDAVFLFDVLEHIYDPWNTLLRLRNLVSNQAQLIVSIPNVRNVMLIQDLMAGYWRYRYAGLLDITHIRFFTQQDMYRMFYQTGFRVMKSSGTHCERSAAIFEQHRNLPFPQTVQLASGSILVHSLDDLTSLCAVQHVFALRPADYAHLSPTERRWIDEPYPPTAAFATD